MSTKEVVLITGANTGIGFEAVKALFQSPKAYHVLLGSRSPANAGKAVAQLAKDVPETQSTVEPVQIDVTDDESIGKTYELVKSKFGRLDVLVNNAGAAFDTTFGKDLDNFRAIFNTTWNVNVTGSQVVTAKMAPLLLAAPSPRLLFLTSGVSTLAGNTDTLMPERMPNPAAGWPKGAAQTFQAYRSAKTGLNMTMLSWHWILREDGVRTWCVSPGFLATNLTGKGEAPKNAMKSAGAGDAALGGDIIKRVVEGERDADVGKVVGQNGIVQAW